MRAADEVTKDIHQFFDGPSGPPRFDLKEAHHGIRGLILHTDFSVTRPPTPVVSANSNFVDGVASKDVTISKDRNLRARIFLPEIGHACKSQQLPVLLYFHGGGFVCLSVDSRMFHDFCEDICKSVKAIVVSIEYRLAPEHRLPSQYEDARLALDWLRLHAERFYKLQEDAVGRELESMPDFQSEAQAPEEFEAAVLELESVPHVPAKAPEEATVREVEYAPQSQAQAQAPEEETIRECESAPDLQSQAEASAPEEATVRDLESVPESESAAEAQASRPEGESSAEVVDSDYTFEPWLISNADFNRLFLVGDSAGGNIVHNLFNECRPENTRPLNISGLILIQPAFGGLKRTPAELSLAQELRCSLDFFWKLALPLEADRSHQYCDVFSKLNDLLRDQQLFYPDTFMVVGGHDSLRDWQLLYYETLSRYGTKIKLANYDDAPHGFYTFRHQPLAYRLLEDLAQFVKDR